MSPNFNLPLYSYGPVISLATAYSTAGLLYLFESACMYIMNSSVEGHFITFGRSPMHSSPDNLPLVFGGIAILSNFQFIKSVEE